MQNKTQQDKPRQRSSCCAPSGRAVGTSSVVGRGCLCYFGLPKIDPMKHLRYPALGLFTLVILTSCQSKVSTENDSKGAVEAWEYREFRAPKHYSFPKDELDQLGTEGWELITVIQDQPNTPRFILKRRQSK